MRAVIFNILIIVSFLSFKLVAQNVDYQAAAKSIDEDLKKEMKAFVAAIGSAPNTSLHVHT